MRATFTQIFLLLTFSAFHPAFAQHEPAWVGQIGGDDTESGNAIAFTYDGLVTVGTFKGTADLDPSSGVDNHTTTSNTAGYISVTDIDGNLLWAKHIDGSSIFSGVFFNDVAVSSFDYSYYIVGKFSETVDFDPGAGEHLVTSANGYDMFVLKLDVNGDFEWVFHFPGTTNNDDMVAVHYDYVENAAYVTGTFSGTITFPSSGTLTAQGYSDGFVMRLSDGGINNGFFHFASSSGGWTTPSGIAVDIDGNVYSVGSYSGTTQFYPDGNGPSLTSSGYEEAFIVKIDPLTLQIPWVRTFESAYYTVPRDVASYYGNHIAVVGYFEGILDLDFSENEQIVDAGGGGVFIVKIGVDGEFIWAGSLGGPGSGYVDVNAVNFNAYGTVYFTGYFGAGPQYVDFDPGVGSYNWYALGGSDSYVMNIWDDEQYWEVDAFQGDYNEQGNDLVVDFYGHYSYVTGNFMQTSDFDPQNPGNFVLTGVSGSQDAFLMSYFWYADPVGVTEEGKEPTISVYPNPTANGFIKVTATEQATLTVVDMQGRVVNTLKLNVGPNALDMVGVAAGVYSLRAVTNSGVVSTGKLVVQ